MTPRNLAIAFSDLDGDHRYGPGDVLISRLFDTNGDGTPSAGDTIFMGRYPLDFDMTAFADWSVDSHTVKTVASAYLDAIVVASDAPTLGGVFRWGDDFREFYVEIPLVNSMSDSWIEDGIRKGTGDRIEVDTGSQSKPGVPVEQRRYPTPADRRFIDVEIYP